MGDGGKTIPVADNFKTVIVKDNIPKDCYPTGVTYACNKPQVQQPTQPQASQFGCRPCEGIRTKIGSFLGKIGRGLYNFGAWAFNGAGKLLCGTANFVGNVLNGIGNGLNRFGAAFNSAMSMPYYQPTQVMYVQQPRQVFGFTSPPPAYPFSMTGSCFPTLSYNNNGFMSGMLFGAMLNNRHHHCHSHISRPLVINRHIGFGRPFGRHWGCC